MLLLNVELSRQNTINIHKNDEFIKYYYQRRIWLDKEYYRLLKRIESISTPCRTTVRM